MEDLEDLEALTAEPEVVFEKFGEYVIAHQPGATFATRNVACGPEPAWISAELRDVLRAQMVASVTGRCPGCGGLREVPPEAKTYAGSALFVDRPIRHEDDCPFDDFTLRLLCDRDCPGPIPDLDLSDAAIAPFLDRLRELQDPQAA